MHNTVLITGATGWLGSLVAKLFVNKQFNVIALARKPDYSIKNIHWVKGDITENDDILNLPKSLELFPDFVVHCAGFAHRETKSQENVDLCHLVNVIGTQNIIRYAKENGIKKFVYISSTSVYDWKSIGNTAATEESPTTDSSVYGVSKLKGEKIVRDSNIDFTIVRLATMFGNGDVGNLYKMAMAMKKDRFIIPGNGEINKSFIHDEAAASAVFEMTFKNAFNNEVVNLALQQPVTLNQISDTIVEYCKFRKPPKVSTGILSKIAFVGDVINKYCGYQLPLTSDKLTSLTQNTAVNTSVLQDLLVLPKNTQFSECFKHCFNRYC